MVPKVLTVFNSMLVCRKNKIDWFSFIPIELVKYNIAILIKEYNKSVLLPVSIYIILYFTLLISGGAS